MNWQVACRILGLSDAATENDIHLSYWGLRAHIESRARASEREDFRSDRAAELRDLDEALRVAEDHWRARAVQSSRPRAPGAARGRRHQRRWLAAWAGLATAVALILASALLERGGAAVLMDSAGASAGPVVAAPAALARVSARGNLAGARLEIEQEGGALIAQAAADGSDHWLPEGEYRLSVRHPDCPDEWERKVALSAGQEIDLSARNCTNTGWIVIRSNVANDRVLIDGKNVGGTGPQLHTVSAGEHQVRVEKSGYEPWEGLAAVRSAKQLTLHAELQRDSKSERQLASKSEESKSGAEHEQLQGGGAVSAGEPSDEDRARREIEARAWQEQIDQWMLSLYDTDASGLIDTPEEVAGIACDRLLGLESTALANLGLPLTRLYGFDGNRWKENALGFSSTVRDLAYARMRECGLQ